METVSQGKRGVHIIPSELLENDKRHERKTSLPKSTGTVIAIVGAAFHQGINGRDLFPRGFVTTQGGGAKADPKYACGRKMSESWMMPLKPTNPNRARTSGLRADR